MTHVKFNRRPFSGSIDNVVDELINGLPVLFNDGVHSLSKHVIVPVNITESNDGYKLEVIAPGFDKEDFKVNLDNNIMTITGEKKEEMKQENEKQVRREYSYRNFKRSFTVDDKIDATAIEASYVNGVLQLNLPKKAEVKEAAKEIKIK